MKDEEFLEMLGKTKLSEENSSRSKKLRMMRTILIDKYINKMSREEICAELNFISLSTYTTYYRFRFIFTSGIIYNYEKYRNFIKTLDTRINTC